MTKRILLVIGVILLISIIATLFIARSPLIRNRLKLIVIHEVNKRAGIDLKSESVDLAFFPPAIEIIKGDVTIPNKANVSFDKAFVKLDALTLLRGGFLIQNLQLRNFKTTLLTPSQKNIAQAGISKTQKPYRSILQDIFALPVQKVEIIGGEFSWPSEHLFSALSRINITKRRNQLNLNLSLDKTSMPMRAKTVLLNHSTFLGTIQENRIKIKKGTVTGDWGSATLKGMVWGGIFDGMDSLLDSEMDLSVNSSIDLSKVVSLIDFDSEIAGQIYAHGSVTNRIRLPRFEGTINGDNFTLSNIRIPKLSASVMGDKNIIQVSPLKLFFADQILKITGKLTPSEKWQMEALVEPEGVPLQDVLKAVGVETDPARGDISGAINIDGSFNPLDFNYRATLSVNNFGAGEEEDVAHFTEGIIETEGKINNDLISFDRAQLIVKNGGVISATGKIDYSGPIRFDFFTDKFQTSSLEQISEIPISGAVSIVGSVTDAPGAATIVQGTIRAEGFSIANMDLGWVRGTVEYAKDIISISDTTVRQGESEYFAKAKINTSTGVFSDSYFSFSKLKYKDIRDTLSYHLTLPEWIDGYLKGGFSVNGALTLEDISGAIDVDMTEVKIAGEEFQSLKFAGKAIKGLFAIQQATLAREKGRIIITGETRLGKDLNLKLISQDTNYEEVTLFSKHKVPLTGNLEVEASLTGPWTNPAGSGFVRVSQVALSGEKLPESILKLNLKNKLLGLTWTLDNEELNLVSSINLEKPYVYDAKINANGYSFDPFLALVIPPGQRFQGRLQGSIDINGTLSPFLIKYGDIQLTSLTIQRGNMLFRNLEQVSLTIRDGKATFSPFRFIGPQTNLILSGSVSLPDKLAIDLNGSFDLSLVEFFIPEITKASGQGNIKTKIGGSISKPDVIGSIHLNQVAFQTKWLAQPIEQLNTRITFSQKLISVEEAEGLMGGGPVSIYGTMSLPDKAPPQFSVHLTSKNNRIRIARNLISKLSSNLHLTGVERPYMLSGEILFDDLVYKERINWQANLFKRKIMPGPKVIKEKSPFVLFNIDLDLQKGFLIDNNLAKILFAGKLKLTGSGEQPNLQGKLELVKGETYFQDNEFKMISGEIVFNDPIEIDPYFNLQAESKVRDYQVAVAIIGYLGDYEVQLSSQPPLSEGDIATLLTLGVTTEEIAGQEGAFAAAELGSLLFGGVSSALEAESSKLFGLKFGVTPSFTTTREANAPKVIVGTQITKNLEASFASTIGESWLFEDREARIEYSFNDNLSVQGTWEDPKQSQYLNPDSQLGVDLRLRFEFR